MSNENETNKTAGGALQSSDNAPENARRLLPREDDEHPWAAETRLDRVLSEGMRPSRPHD